MTSIPNEEQLRIDSSELRLNVTVSLPVIPLNTSDSRSPYRLPANTFMFLSIFTPPITKEAIYGSQEM